MVYSGTHYSNCQIITKDGARLQMISVKGSMLNDSVHLTLNNEHLTLAEVTQGYFYLLELQKLRKDYLIENKKNSVLNQQINEYQNQLALKDDMIKNLESYAEQVKPEWWQHEIAIIAWIAGACALTYLITN